MNRIDFVYRMHLKKKKKAQFFLVCCGSSDAVRLFLLIEVGRNFPSSNSHFPVWRKLLKRAVVRGADVARAAGGGLLQSAGW